MTSLAPEQPDLFFAPDTCALASLITCFEAGLDPRVVAVDFSSEEQRAPEFLAVNSKARVPALRVGDAVITETPAILTYLAAVSKKHVLVPADPVAYAQVQAFNSYLCSTVHVAHAHRMRGYRWVDGEVHEEAMRAKVPEAVGECYRCIEDDFLIGPYVFGEDFSIADPYLFTIAQWMEDDGVAPSRFPKVAAHRENMLGRPTVMRALEIEAAL